MQGAKKPRFFYGWVIVVVSAVVTFANSGLGGGAGFGLFIRPMTAELGSGQTFFGLAFTARSVTVALVAPFIGRMIDKYGARVPLAIAGGLTGLIVVGQSFISAPWQLMACFALMGLLGLQSQLYTSVPVAQWFVRKRGRAMSMVFLGTPAGVFTWTNFTQFAIAHYGWRSAWRVTGVFGAITIVLISLLFMRKSPESQGLLPDGDKPGEQAAQIADGQGGGRGLGGRSAEYQWTRKEAVRTSAFWKLVIGFGLVAFANGTMILFRVPYFQEKGISSALVALSISVEAIPQVVLAFALSGVLDRVQTRYAAVTGVLFFITSMLVIMTASTAWQMFLGTIIFGFGIASQSIVANTIWADYFGRANLGSIRGLAVPVTLAISAAGAPLAGLLRDITGTYYIAWWIALACLITAAMLIFSTRRPEPERAKAPAQLPV